MAAGNVGYTDTRSFSGSLLGDIARGIKDRVKGAAQMARNERAFAEEQAEKQDTSLDEAGIGRGYFFRRALGSKFGGDRIARTRGYFEKNPPMGRDPLGTIESRFRGGFDYGLPQEELKKSVSQAPPSQSSGGGGTSGTTSSVGEGGKEKPIKVKHTRLTTGMLSTFQRLENQLTRITDRIGTGSSNPQTVYALENQKMLLGSVFAKTTNITNALTKAFNDQTGVTNKVANDAAVAAEKAADEANRKLEESGAEGQDAKALNKKYLKLRNGMKGGAGKFFGPGSRLKDLFGPASDIGRFGLRRGKTLIKRMIGRGGRRALARAGRIGAKAIKPVGVLGGKIVGKLMGKSAAKIAGKGVAKSLAKKIPLLGAVAGVAFGIERAMKGDFLGALGEVASGVASTVPGVGTAISVGIDAALVAKDINDMQNSPGFAEGGVVPRSLSASENEEQKRNLGVDPIDRNYWREYWTRETKLSNRQKNLQIDIERRAYQTYFTGIGAKQFADGMKGMFSFIANAFNRLVAGAGRHLTRGVNFLKGLLGLTQSVGPQMTASGGAKVTQSIISRGVGVKDGLGSGADPGGHTGYDLSGPNFNQGDPISFLPPGKVIDVGIIGDANDPGNENGGYGNFVVVKTDSGTIVKMAHFDSVNVSKGQRVGSDGEGDATVIGKVGNTGLSTGPHLHIETGTGYIEASAKTTGIFDAGIDGLNNLIRGGGDVKVHSATEVKTGETGDEITYEDAVAKVQAAGQTWTPEMEQDWLKLWAEMNPDKVYAAEIKSEGPEKYQWNAELGIPEQKNPLDLMTPAQQQQHQKHMSAVNAMFRAVDTGGARALLKTARYKEELAEMTASQGAGITVLEPPPAQAAVIPEMTFGRDWTSAQENQARQLYNVYIQSLR
jgi:murein DD-endopeptidase MepM/ murein hydrolase activator NlpD